MPDAPLRLVAHPLPVVAHVLGKPLRAGPVAFDQRRFGRRPAGPGLRVDRRPAGELRRDLDHRLVDEHRHRVQVAGMGLKPQALRLQRQGAAPRERIVEGRQPVRVEQLGGARMPGVVGASTAPAPADLLPGLFQQLFIGGVLPAYQLLDQAEQSFALLLLVLLGGELLGAGRRIVHHLREDHRPRRGQGTARPPEMQGARVPVPDRLLPRRRGVDGVEGQGDLDELLAGDAFSPSQVNQNRGVGDQHLHGLHTPGLATLPCPAALPCAGSGRGPKFPAAPPPWPRRSRPRPGRESTGA